jgi:hypothetical protein
VDELVTPEAYIRATAGRSFAWGRHDCVLWVADYVMCRAGWDPAEAVRGRYASRFEAHRILRAAGGLRAWMRAAMARAPQVQNLDGVAVAAVHRVTACGLVWRGRFFGLGPQGVTMPSAPVLLERWGI